MANLTYTIHFTIGDVITVVSILVTVASMLWAFYERRNTRGAREEAARFRQLLIQRQIAEHFAQVPQMALDLNRAVRAHSWESAAEAALKLCAELATLRGADRDLVGQQHRDDIKMALEMAGEVNSRIPHGQTPADGPAELMPACNMIVSLVHTINRAITSRTALGGENDA